MTTLDEIIFQQRQKEIERVDPERIAFIDAEMARRRGGTRRAIARGLVRLGTTLDRDAGERAIVLRRQASH
jgi:hypothetical protein